MRKELLIAILLGFGVGLIFTYGLFIAQRAVKQKQTAQPPTDSPSSSVSEATPSHSLIVTSPQDESVIRNPEINLEGKTSTNATLTVLTEKNEIIHLADDQGNFSIPIKLISGANVISLYSFSENQEQINLTLSLVYTTAEI